MGRRDDLVLVGGSMTAAVAGCSSSDDSGLVDGTGGDTGQSGDGQEQEQDQDQNQNDDEATGVLSVVPAEVDPGTVRLNVVGADGIAIGGASVTGDGIDETTNEDGIVTVELVASATEAISSFEGITTSEFTAFAEDNEFGARENGISFPPGDVTVDGNVSGGQWNSTNVNFEELSVRGDPTQVKGLSGTFDEENELMTVEGGLQLTVRGDNPSRFSYKIAATTGESDALSGSANVNDESGTATIVDNEYTAEVSDDSALKSILGLPVEQPGRAWIELSLKFDFQRG